MSGLEALPAYTITGNLQSIDEGLYAGLDSEGMVVVLDHSGGRRKGVSGMTPIGIHRWDGQLYLVGEADGRPKIAAIDDDGDIGKAQTWDASRDAQDELGSKIDVIDDRTLPSTQTVWRDPRTAAGSFPFLHAHTLDRHASETTSWLIAGPTFTAQSEENTAIAFVPVGIAYEE